jgi:hypothetical protein
MSRETIPKQLLANIAGVLDGPYCEVVEPTKEQKQLYCAHIAIGSSMHRAASEVGLPYLSFGRALVTDEKFSEDLDAARALRSFALEEILLDQSTVGVDAPLTYQGHVTMVPVEDELTGEQTLQPMTIKKLITSNPSLVALLKANNPEKFRERSEVKHTMPGENDDIPERITNSGDREKIVALLARRARDRAEADATVIDSTAVEVKDNEDLL